VTPEQRQELIRLLEKGEDISPEWARILFPPEKREYELVYHGKDREEDIIADTLAVPLQAVRTFGQNGVDWHNMLIFGDNLQAMKTLLEMKKAGKLRNADGTDGVRLVYIDPPFATRREFKGSQDQKAYQDRIAGAEFVEFLRKRLVLIKNLLAEDGNIVVHLDNRKLHYIKVVMDEVFGEQNFINEVIWHKGREGGSSRSHSAGSAIPTEYQNLLVYASNRRQRHWRLVLGPYKVSTVSRIEKDENGWFYTRGRMGRQPAEWEIEAGVSLKTYVSGDPTKTKEQVIAEITGPKAEFVALGDIWSSQIVPLTTCTDYPTEKPERLLSLLVKSGSQEGDIILDAFSGSGTTLAVSEKLGRSWIGLDCGKLSVYTIQKRMLNLRAEIGNKGPKLEAKPFTLYNAGLYDFSTLKELSWQDWRFFALQLFGCRDERHKIGGIEFDGYRQGQSVMIFNHMEAKHKGACITEETIQEIHEAAGSRVGSKVFIIAPALAFDFQQDYIDLGKVRYYALRIPYSIIHELHRREFKALKQPSDEMAVNDTVEAVGFDFIRTPELQYKTGTEKPKGELFEVGFIKIETFKSDAVVREPFRKKGNLETLSMVMLDFDYDETNKVFDFDAVFYADALEKEGWKVRFQTDQLGKKMMAVFIDIYGNEARVLINAAEFGKAVPKKKNGQKK